MLAGSGTSVLSGSSIQAGTQAATLKLDRGGSLLVCEGTKLSITSSQNGRQLLLSLNSGNVELNYPLGTEADTLLTPDVRLLHAGTGNRPRRCACRPEWRYLRAVAALERGRRSSFPRPWATPLIR